MKCHQAEKWMDAALDAAHGSGLPAGTHVRLEEHLAACPNCRRQWDLLRAAEQALRVPRLAAAPEDMLADFRRRLHQDSPAARPARSRWNWLWPVSSLAAAGATAALAIALNVTGPHLVSAPERTQVASNPAPAAAPPQGETRLGEKFARGGAGETAAAGRPEPLGIPAPGVAAAGGPGPEAVAPEAAALEPGGPPAPPPGGVPGHDPFRTRDQAPIVRESLREGGAAAPESLAPGVRAKSGARERQEAGGAPRGATVPGPAVPTPAAGGLSGGVGLGGGFGGPRGAEPPGPPVPRPSEEPAPPAPSGPLAAPPVAAKPARPGQPEQEVRLRAQADVDRFFDAQAQTPVELDVSPALLNALQRPVAVELDQLTVQAAAVKLTEKADIAVVVDPKAPLIRVSLEKTNVPFWLVLENVARQGGMRIHPEANQLVLRPAPDGKALPELRAGVEQQPAAKKEGLNPQEPRRNVAQQAPPQRNVMFRQLHLHYNYRGQAPDRAIWAEEWGVLPEAGFTVTAQEALLQQQVAPAQQEAAKLRKEAPAAQKGAPEPQLRKKSVPKRKG